MPPTQCGRHLTVGTFCSPEFKLPPLRGEISRRERKEYIVKLQEEGWDSSLSSNHKRNIKKAVTAGVTVQRVGGRLDRLAEHVRLMEKSLGRRTARGESVPVGSGDKEEIQSYLEFGAGELYQAVRNDIVLSSILVLRSKSVAYYQSAGTSPDGMSVGASHFLIHETCKILRSDGVRVFNLGGAPEGSSLARFKVGFGAAEVSLEACSCDLGPLWLKKVRTALNMVRSGRNRL